MQKKQYSPIWTAAKYQDASWHSCLRQKKPKKKQVLFGGNPLRDTVALSQCTVLIMMQAPPHQHVTITVRNDRNPASAMVFRKYCFPWKHLLEIFRKLHEIWQRLSPHNSLQEKLCTCYCQSSIFKFHCWSSLCFRWWGQSMGLNNEFNSGSNSWTASEGEYSTLCRQNSSNSMGINVPFN